MEFVVFVFYTYLFWHGFMQWGIGECCSPCNLRV